MSGWVKRRHVAMALLLGLAAACQAPARDHGPQPPAVPTTTQAAPTPATGESPAVPPPAPGGWRYVYVGEELGGEFWDVVATGPREAWAVGVRDGKAFLLGYDGSAWRPAPLPDGLGDIEVIGDLRLGASGQGGLWLFRSDDQGTRVFRRDGTGWRRLPPYQWHVGDAQVFAPDDVWVIAEERRAGHWDGARWRTVTLPAQAGALDAAAPDDMWAVGHRASSATPGPLTQPAAMHWNGRAWRLVPTPAYRFPDPAPPEEDAFLTGVVALSAKEAWAVGEHTFNHGEGGPDPADPPPIVLRWNGSTWSRHPVPTPPICCPKLAPDGSGGVLLGSSGPGLGNTWRLAPDGAATRLPRMKVDPKASRKQYGSIEAMTRIPGTSTVLAVGRLSARAWSRAAIAEFNTNGK
ncbi:hypothetical protein [Nonomuraea sp. NPDC050786]|uniref:hypothetical protein n=1 Tax=Nonomuraea sp. NPDC050786 TaxID=3154840 RepID=UPI00340FDF39